MTTLLWFRRDMRLSDHPALLAAAQDHATDVLACYVLDPRLTASSRRTRRLRYLFGALQELRTGLGGKLLVVRGRPEQQIPRLVHAVGADSVHITQDYSPFGRRRDDAVRAALDGVPLCATGSPYLV